MTPDPDRILGMLTALVAIPSVTGAEEAVQDEVARSMEAVGLEVERRDVDPEVLSRDPAWPGAEMPRATLPLVAGRLEGRRPGPRLVLLGHVDVVPPGDPGSWTTPPFQPRVEGGLLYGRGACDMKGGLVSILEAARLLADRVDELSGQLLVVAVPSEEDGGSGALAAIRSGYRGDMAVITEPTRLEVVVAHAGAITFRLDVPGKAAHASTRREGVSALEKLSLLLEVLAADEAARNEAETDPLMRALGLPYPTIVGTVRGGEWASSVLDLVTVHGRYGVRLGQSPEQAAEDLRAALARAWEQDELLAARPMRLEVTGGRFGSCRIPSNHPLPVGLADAAERVTGTRPPLVGAPYGADMRLLVEVGGTPTVMFGPGDVRHAHAADERVPLAEVATCAGVLAEWAGSVLA